MGKYTASITVRVRGIQADNGRTAELKAFHMVEDALETQEMIDCDSMIVVSATAIQEEDAT